ncbi:MAG: hypothetical protein QM756_06985 [Polyangiaceae bacterium]
MTVEGALEVLGLVGSGLPEPTPLRRAYLRAVRAHPPERDADGFRRVREAYEFLKARTGNAQARTSFAEALERDSPLPPAAKPGSESEPAAADAPRAAAPTTPGPARFEPPPREPEPPLVAPEPMPKPEPDPFAERIEKLRLAMEAGQTLVAATLLGNLYAEGRAPPASLPPPAECCRLALLLLADNQGRHAVSLLQALDAHVARIDSSASDMSTHVAGQWLLLRELSQVHERADAEAAHVLAKGLRDDDLVRAARRISQLCARQPLLHKQLASAAPTFWRRLAPALQSFQALRDAARPKPLWPGYAAFVVAVMLAIRLLLGASPSTRAAPQGPASSPMDLVLNEESRSAMDAAVALNSALDARDCNSAEQHYRSLVLQLKGRPPYQDDPLRLLYTTLKARIQTVCPNLDLTAETSQ